MKTYNIGVIGAGFMGHVHSYCWTAIPFFYHNPDFRCVLKAVCTSRPETAATVREELGFVKSYTSIGELVDDPEIDIIDIAAPNNVHMEALLAAHRVDKPVYCDKPLTGNLEQARKLKHEIKAPDKLGQLTLQYRFYPATMRARQLIDDGKLGDVISFRAEYLHSGNVVAGKRLNWKDSRANGAGVLYDLGSHAVDLVTWLCGSGIAEVFARQKTLHKLRPSASDPSVLAEQDSDDMTAMVVSLATGALGTIEVSKIATGSQDELRFEIHGTRGALRFNLMQPNYLEYFDSADPELPLGGESGFKRIHCLQRFEAPAGFPGPKFSIGWLRGHLHCLYSFINAVHSGNPFEPSVARGIELEEWLAMAQASASDGQHVNGRGG